MIEEWKSIRNETFDQKTTDRMWDVVFHGFGEEARALVNRISFHLEPFGVDVMRGVFWELPISNVRIPSA